MCYCTPTLRTMYCANCAPALHARVKELEKNQCEDQCQYVADAEKKAADAEKKAADATEAYSKLLSSMAMAGTLDAAELKYRVDELEEAIRRMLIASKPVSLGLPLDAIMAKRQEYNNALAHLHELGIDLEEPKEKKP